MRKNHVPVDSAELGVSTVGELPPLPVAGRSVGVARI